MSPFLSARAERRPALLRLHPAPLTRPLTALVDELPHNVAAAWSSDGRHIVYLSSRTEDNEHGPWCLWVVDAAGGNQRAMEIGI